MDQPGPVRGSTRNEPRAPAVGSVFSSDHVSLCAYINHRYQFAKRLLKNVCCKIFSILTAPLLHGHCRMIKEKISHGRETSKMGSRPRMLIIERNVYPYIAGFGNPFRDSRDFCIVSWGRGKSCNLPSKYASYPVRSMRPWPDQLNRIVFSLPSSLAFLASRTACATA
jgi:hypothetical protein